MSPPDPQEVIHIVASLLSVERGEDGCVAPIEHGITECEQRLASLISSKNNDHVQFTCPALSLVHDDPLNFNHENAKEAEKSAFQLLSRPMGFEISSETCDVERLANEKLSEVRRVLLMNINESFALLVDSRLRAHATFMAMHSLSIAEKKLGEVGGLDKKLETLLEIGDRVTGTKTEVKIEVLDDEENEGPSTKASSAISFQVAMQLFIESYGGAPNSSLSVRCETSGSLDVYCGGKTFVAKLEIDIHELLTQMKESAAEVVAQVIEMTNSFFVVPKPIFHRGESYLAMPPPQMGLRGESSTQNQALISPDLTACSQGPEDVPFMMLNEDEYAEASDLSPDQCASILDDVFGDVDITVFSSSARNNDIRNSDRRPLIEDGNSRPSKKVKTGD
ncbi:hypothetical protein ACA910_012916 [Epithemia clementina (nom. ined.)]